MQQGVDSVVQSLFLYGAHIFFLQSLNKEADHIAGVLGKQGGKIILGLGIIYDLSDAESGD